MHILKCLYNASMHGTVIATCLHEVYEENHINATSKYTRKSFTLKSIKWYP
jgi:hypothetical protein